jgi:hypothetical protein
VLLRLLVAAFVPTRPRAFVDDTIEHRRGQRIAAKGIYRDAVRSIQSYFVRASALRWVCLTVLVLFPWVART